MTKYLDEIDYFEKNKTETETTQISESHIHKKSDIKLVRDNLEIDYNKYSKNIAHAKVIGRIVEQNNK